jgi:RNA polymerase sigma factor (sigma-70 family)
MLLTEQADSREMAAKIGDESAIAGEVFSEILPDTWRAFSPRRRVDYSVEPNGEVVRKAAKGDDRAWRELVKRFGPMVMCVAQRMGLNGADAADVQQATWVQLMRHADQVRDPECIGAWLATTARRQSQRIAMAAHRQVPSPDPLANSFPVDRPDEDVEAAVLRSQYDGALQRALNRLPDSYRRLLQVLTSDACPSYEEAAKALNLPVGSIGPMRQRGLQMLRRDSELRKYGAA